VGNRDQGEEFVGMLKQEELRGTDFEHWPPRERIWGWRGERKTSREEGGGNDFEATKRLRGGEKKTVRGQEARKDNLQTRILKTTVFRQKKKTTNRPRSRNPEPGFQSE